MTILPIEEYPIARMPGTIFPETPPQFSPIGGTDAIPVGTAGTINNPTAPIPIPDAPIFHGGAPINITGITNTTGGMTTGGMNAGSTTQTANIDWYELLKAIGFTKGTQVQPTETVSPAGTTIQPVQQASLLPSININTIVIVLALIIVVYLITR